VWLDLGRAQERANDYAAAMESYSQSIKLDPTHAAPWLLRGMVQGRRQELAAMAADFQKAQSIFEASQNFEGQAEVAYQQGRLAIVAKNLAVARPSLARALDLAEKTGSEFHRVRTLMKMSVVTYMEGDASKAQEVCTQAIARARAARMPILTVQGLVELGNAQLSKLDLKAAEATLREAVALAQSDHLPESEALSRISLGSVLVQSGQDEAAIPHLNAAMEFYSKGQSRSEINACRLLLGRVYRRRGEFVQVHRLLNEILREAEAAGDQGKATDVLGEIASAYAAQQRFGEALSKFELRLERLKDSKAVADIGFSLVGKARMLIELGALDQARATIDEAQQRAGASEGVAQRLKSLQRDLLYRSGQWGACALAYAEALRDKQDELQSAARQIECLAFARKLAEARHLSATVERKAQEVKSHDAAWLRVACALVESEPSKAASSLDEAIGYFRKQEQLASLWMAESVAAAAFRRSGDASKAALHAQASLEALKMCEARFPEHLRQKYAVLPVVVHYQKMRT
jgi:tetratricopeptide (TPR) repeat protein